MPWGAGNLLDNPEFRRLQVAVDRIQARLGIVDRRATDAQTASAMAAASTDKRFRIAVKNVGLSLIGVVNVDLVWSSPLPSATYKVDVNCSALIGMPTVTVTNQTAAGCTISFSPGLAVTNATVIALAIAPVTT